LFEALGLLGGGVEGLGEVFVRGDFGHFGGGAVEMVGCCSLVYWKDGWLVEFGFGTRNWCEAPFCSRDNSSLPSKQTRSNHTRYR
jgi:hypothetical protein